MRRPRAWLAPYARRLAAERDEATTVDKHGDRIERRRLIVPKKLQGYLNRPRDAQVRHFGRTVTVRGRMTVEIQCIVDCISRSRVG